MENLVSADRTEGLIKRPALLRSCEPPLMHRGEIKSITYKHQNKNKEGNELLIGIIYDTTGIRIKNNILVDNQLTQLVLEQDTDNKLDFNLILSSWGQPLVRRGVQKDHEEYYHLNTNDKKGWNDKSGQDEHSQEADPLDLVWIFKRKNSVKGKL